MQLQEVALLIQLVGVTVEKAENRLQFWQRVVRKIHDWRLMSVEHRHWARGEIRTRIRTETLLSSGRGRGLRIGGLFLSKCKRGIDSGRSCMVAVERVFGHLRFGLWRGTPRWATPLGHERHYPGARHCAKQIGMQSGGVL
jgi:hypothetical protein